VAATWIPAGVISTPAVVDLNIIRTKGWALFAQPFFLRIYAKIPERVQPIVSQTETARLIAEAPNGMREEKAP